MKRFIAILIIGLILFPSVSFGAIARDNVTVSGYVTTPTLTFSHTNTAVDILWVGVVVYSGNNVISGVTYNGVSMTQTVNIAQGANGRVHLYYLVSPAMGANNVVVSQSGTDQIHAIASSYTSASTIGVPDATNTNSGVASSPATVSVTSVATNVWGVGVTWTNRVNSDGTNASILGGDTSQFSMFDSNGTLTPAGSKTFDVNMSSASSWVIGVSTFAEASVPVALPTPKPSVYGFWW